MSSDRSEQVRRLQDLLIAVRHAIEVAEARVADCNDVVQQLGKLRVIPHAVFLGPAMSQPYDAKAGRVDTGLVIQAALLIPEGFGVCRYDTEEYWELRGSPDRVEREAVDHFVPFSGCEAAEKAFLNYQIDALFRQLVVFVEQWRLPVGPP